MVDAALDKGANPNVADANARCIMRCGLDYGIEQGTKATAVTVVKTLLAHGADPNARLRIDEEKAAAERKANAGGVGARAKRNAMTITEIELNGATPVALAAEVNNLEAIKALVDAGADPLIGTETGTTPLMLASGAGTDVQRARSPEERATAVQTAKYLVDHGADKRCRRSADGAARASYQD